MSYSSAHPQGFRSPLPTTGPASAYSSGSAKTRPLPRANDQAGITNVPARAGATEAGVTLEFRLESGEAFVADAEFDAVFCLFTTLGQISEEGDNSRLVKRAYQAVRPGGAFAVEVPQRAPTVRNLKPTDRFEGPRRYTLVSRHFEPGDNSIS